MLILPIETKRRELKSKLLLCFHLLRKGESVIIGHDLIIKNSHNIKDSTILLKSAASFEAKSINSYFQRGNKIFSLDEEGIIPPIHDPSVNSRFDKSFLNKIDKILLNSDLELELINNAYTGDKLVKTGNPRLDLCKEKYELLFVDEIQKIKSLTNHQDIVLIASRFGDVNLHSELDYFRLLADAGYTKDQNSKEYFLEHYQHTEKIFKEFLKLPSLIAKQFPEKMIVVRPHPSEDISSWKFSEQNIIVSNKYDIASWIHCNPTLIHNGCTTAVEAAVRGINIISYKPHENDRYDNSLADELGVICENPAMVMDQLKKFNTSAVRRKVASFMYVDYEVDSAELIANEISGLSAHVNYNKLDVPLKIKLRKKKIKLEKLLGIDSYIGSKFDFLRASEIRAILESIIKINTSKFGIKIKKLSDDVFLVERA